MSGHSFRLRPREVIVNGNAVTLEETGYGARTYTMQRVRVGRHKNSFEYIRSTDPTVEMLRDLAGNPVRAPHLYQSYNGERRKTDYIHLRNLTRQPWPESATVDGARLTLTFRAPLKGPMRGESVPAASAFTVKVNGSAVSLASANPVSMTDWNVRFGTVTLTLAAAVASGDTVTVSYDKPDSNWLRNVVCEYVPSFTDEPVTNSTS